MSKNLNVKNTAKAEKASDEFSTVKGFRDIIGEDYYKYQGIFEKAQEVAVYYGFSPVELPILEYTDIFERGIGDETDVIKKELFNFSTKGGDKVAMRPEFTAGNMRAYLGSGWGSLPQPIMIYNYGDVFRHDKPQKGRYRQFKQFNLEILGSEKSIMDAMIIKTATTILREVGLGNTILKINSIGDKESRKKYEKDLIVYYKKHKSKLCKTCLERLTENPLRLLDCKEESCNLLKPEAPKAMASLNPESKQHFKEVLKYLDEMEINYEIDHTLVRGLDYYAHTVFEFVNTIKQEDGTEKETSIGGGGRYDYLAKAMGAKKDISAVGMAFGVDRMLLCSGSENIKAKIQKDPKIFFVQLGFEAKLKSLQIIEMLRQNKIPIAQSLSKDSLSIQLGMAERMEIPYAIIFGQKEAMAKEVIIRNMTSRSQETVKIEKLVEYVKKLK